VLGLPSAIERDDALQIAHAVTQASMVRSNFVVGIVDHGKSRLEQWVRILHEDCNCVPKPAIRVVPSPVLHSPAGVISGVCTRADGLRDVLEVAHGTIALNVMFCDAPDADGLHSWVDRGLVEKDAAVAARIVELTRVGLFTTLDAGVLYVWATTMTSEALARCVSSAAPLAKPDGDPSVREG
jgi:hypothetical protein